MRGGSDLSESDSEALVLPGVAGYRRCVRFGGGAMSDDALEEFRQASTGWALEQELEVAAEVYGPGPTGLRTPPSELSDEELLERYKSMLGFDLKWE
jgi:hypothetical protein